MKPSLRALEYTNCCELLCPYSVPAKGYSPCDGLKLRNVQSKGFDALIGLKNFSRRIFVKFNKKMKYFYFVKQL